MDLHHKPTHISPAPALRWRPRRRRDVRGKRKTQSERRISDRRIGTLSTLIANFGAGKEFPTFRTTGGVLQHRLTRMPDGEPGGRKLFISWQYPLLRANPYLSADESSGPTARTGIPSNLGSAQALEAKTFVSVNSVTPAKLGPLTSTSNARKNADSCRRIVLPNLCTDSYRLR